MPFQLPTWLDSATKSIALILNPAKIRGVQLNFPDQVSVTDESAAYLTANGVGGFATTGAEADGLLAAVAVERVNISKAAPVWGQGQLMTNGTEPGIVRKWVRGTGGSDAANAAASNANTIVVGGIRTLLLGATTNARSAAVQAPGFCAFKMDAIGAGPSTVQIAESDDGTTWTTVMTFTLSGVGSVWSDPVFIKSTYISAVPTAIAGGGSVNVSFKG